MIHFRFDGISYGLDMFIWPRGSLIFGSHDVNFHMFHDYEMRLLFAYGLFVILDLCMFSDLIMILEPLVLSYLRPC